jgi:hypothetical protein
MSDVAQRLFTNCGDGLELASERPWRQVQSAPEYSRFCLGAASLGGTKQASRHPAAPRARAGGGRRMILWSRPLPRGRMIIVCAHIVT